MDDLDFSKILQDAEALSSEIEGATDMPRVQRNLRQVLEAGQTLVSRNAKDEPAQNAETKASVFLGTKGVDITKMSKKLEPLYNVVSSVDGQAPGMGSDVDVDAFLRGERTNIIYSSIESTSKSLFNRVRENIRNDLKNSWAKEKQRILNTLSSGGGGGGPLDPSLLMDYQLGSEYRHSVYDKRMESSSVLSKTELTYSHEVDFYVQALVNNQPKPNLMEKFEIVSRNINDKNVQELWESVSTMISSLPVNPVPSVIEKRANPRVRKTFILRAKNYLEKSFFTKVQNEVWKNLGGGRLGGIPSVSAILKNFVNMKNILCVPELEVGPSGSGPVWVMVYIFLRSGHVQEAISYLRDEAGKPDFANILAEYAKGETDSGSLGLPSEIEVQIRLEYMRVMRSNNADPYKRLVYCVLGACDVSNDHPEIANRLDDYLWLKLSQIRDEPPSDAKHHNDFLTYSAFQDMILEKYGESHFDAFKQPFTYFQALLLTGQFEAALEFLSRVSNLRSHAIHVAIVMYELGLLIVSDPKSLPLVRIKSDPPGLRRLNYCYMLVQYAKTFQGSNTKEAINYLYLLRNMKDRNGSSLFSVCVSDMAIESKNFESLFGAINNDGCRSPGILERMGVNIKPIVDYCAAQSETNGMLEDAVVLYDLGGKAEAALTVLNRLIARHASRKPTEGSVRVRVQAIALVLAERYQAHPPEFTNRVVSSTFFLLVDLMTFFDEFHSRRTENALTIIERIRILPFRKEEVERCVANFHSYSDEVRMNIPDLILATMESLHIKYKRIKAEERGGIGVKGDSRSSLDELKGKAKSLVTYCGLIPYFMTGDVYSKVMQIEVQIN